ncbi:MAG: tRNA (guanosine(37)-N1)-methyltransferase TrmD [Acidobacteria bacterium]|nr:tRNA (guanosine(37)-N1)-methyltransferase TrmD [Acidobacteriota bacterium]
MRIDILTIFPDFFRGPLDHGILRRARDSGLVQISIQDLRGFTRDRHKTVDDRPFGGGEGMVLKPEPIFECLESLQVDLNASARASSAACVILLSAQGKLFRQPMADELSGLKRLVLVCGRYEGVDERVAEFVVDREVSVGDYILSGGELAAAIVADSVVRLIPGALGNEASARQESFSGPARTSGGLGETAAAGYTGSTGSAEPPAQPGPASTCTSGGLLDYPHYTRPADFRGMKVPEVLVSGNHSEIRRWRRRKALEKTLRNRPDLLERVSLSGEDRELIAQIVAEMRK